MVMHPLHGRGVLGDSLLLALALGLGRGEAEAGRVRVAVVVRAVADQPPEVLACV